MITILGPTASGKTTLAANVAYQLDGEVISADSRQVYRGMSIGTGKDLSSYTIKGKNVPYHLIDIVDPGYEYNIFEFKRDFSVAYSDIVKRGKTPVLCGGSGMYLESVIKNYQLNKAVSNPWTIESLKLKTDNELTELLHSLRPQHNTTDLLDRNRIIRAILIGLSQEENDNNPGIPESITSSVYGIYWERSILRERITERLKARLKEGMIEEVKELMNKGISAEKLKFYGLEYRYITLYIENKLDYDEMFRLLNIAIHQFAKRQMTWFRKMERNGEQIIWLKGDDPLEKNLKRICRH